MDLDDNRVHVTLDKRVVFAGDVSKSLGDKLSELDAEHEEKTGIGRPEAEDALKLGIGSVFGIKKDAFAKELSPVIRRTYIVLDRRNTPAESRGFKRFTWQITTKKDNREPGYIYLPWNMKRIVKIRLMPFKFNTEMTAVNLEIPDMPFTVNIPELLGGFEVGADRFQFMGRPLFTGDSRGENMIITFDKGNKNYDRDDITGIPAFPVRTYDYNDGVFYPSGDFVFRNTISVEFGFPFKKLALKQARFAITDYLDPAANGNIPVELVIDNPTNITTSNDTVYVEDFATDDSARDAFLLTFLADDVGWWTTIGSVVKLYQDQDRPYTDPNTPMRFQDFFTGTAPDVTAGYVYSSRLGFQLQLEITYEVEE
jgi:hypothetical protein